MDCPLAPTRLRRPGMWQSLVQGHAVAEGLVMASILVGPSVVQPAHTQIQIRTADTLRQTAMPCATNKIRRRTLMGCPLAPTRLRRPGMWQSLVQGHAVAE